MMGVVDLLRRLARVPLRSPLLEGGGLADVDEIVDLELRVFAAGRALVAIKNLELRHTESSERGLELESES